jgi:hypothetical protein
MEYWEAV